MFAVRQRWGDNDRYFGPFTFAKDKSYRPIAVMLKSGDDEHPKGYLRLSAFGGTMLVALSLVPPERMKVFPTSWDAETVKRLGRDWYWDIKPREYGFSYNEGFLSVHYGRQTMDSSTEQSWGWFTPWTQWRHVRHSLYGLDGSFFADIPDFPRLGQNQDRWEERTRIEESCPTRVFAFKDFDGEALTVTTKIEEREWRFGTGHFKWLSLFRKPKIRRSLDLRFSDETGRRKGSWKGGTVGAGIDMLPGELHATAFERYCSKNDMTYGGPVLTEQP